MSEASYILSGQKLLKMPKIVNLTNQKPVTYDQTALPDRSILIEQKLAKSAKIEKCKWDILGCFQTLWILKFVVK